MNLDRIIKHLFPDIAPSQYTVRNLHKGAGEFIYEWNYSDPQPTAEELQAAEPAANLAYEKKRSKDVVTLHGLQYANTTNDPLTGEPISTANDAETIRQHTFSAGRYWAIAYPTADQATKDAIDAVKAEQDRLTGVALTIHSEIDAVSDIASLPSDSDLINDPRW